MSRPTQLSSDLDGLLHRIAHGDVGAFAEFYDATRARVYGLVTRVLRDPGYSEEITQDVYVQVWRSAAAYDSGVGSALSWVLTMAHRRAVDRVRSEEAANRRDSRYGLSQFDTAADVVADAIVVRDERRRVADCLGSLSELQRQCVELAYYDGLTYVQVSERLSASLGTVKSRMRDALRSLRNCLGVQ
ncbi:sigma-70 family RNA polymerase sigma factor [Mycolicibacterium thermoresistibile]